MPDEPNTTQVEPEEQQEPQVQEGEATPEEGAPEEEPAMDATILRKELDRARKEAAKYRTSLREKEEAEKTAEEEKRKAEQTAEERAKEAEQKAQKALEEAEAKVMNAERRAALAGKVTNPDRVLRLLDDPESYFEDTTPNVDAILRDFPEYAPTKTSVGGGSRPANNQDDGALTIHDFKGKSQDWINQNWHRLKR